MCWCIPGKVISLEGKNGTIQIENITKEVRFDLLEHVEIGDYVLVHAGYAIEKVDQEQADFTIKLFKGEIND